MSLQMFLNLAYIFFTFKENVERWIHDKYTAYKVKKFNNKVLHIVGLNVVTRELKTIYNYDNLYSILVFMFWNKDAYLSNLEDLSFHNPDEVYAYTFVKNEKIQHHITDYRKRTISSLYSSPPLYCFIENTNGSLQYDFINHVKPFINSMQGVNTGDLMTLLYYFKNGRRISSRFKTMKIMMDDETYKEMAFDLDQVFHSHRS